MGSLMTLSFRPVNPKRCLVGEPIKPTNAQGDLLGLSELDVKAELVVSPQRLDGDGVANTMLFHGG